jgi:hypothetical protein
MCRSGDIGFGASFECLRKSDNRTWVHMFTGPAVRVAMQATLRRMLLPDWLCDFIKKYIVNGPQAGPFQAYVRETVLARMQWTTTRTDLVEGLLKKEEAKVRFQRAC